MGVRHESRLAVRQNLGCRDLRDSDGQEDAGTMNQATIQLAISGVMAEVIATGLMVSLFTAQEPRPTQAGNGAITFDYVNVAGLINIPCIAAPESPANIVATEVRALTEITASEIRHVLLDTWYPQLDAGWRGEAADGKGAWIASIDGFQFEISGVESDSQTQMTRVKVKLATV